VGSFCAASGRRDQHDITTIPEHKGPLVTIAADPPGRRLAARVEQHRCSFRRLPRSAITSKGPFGVKREHKSTESEQPPCSSPACGRSRMRRKRAA
jgi:hypothetical protein